jgi:hypothetical protein
MCGECWVEREGAETDANVEAAIKGSKISPEAARAARMGIRRPVQAVLRERDELERSTPDTCCFCGQRTRLGIFVRWDPRDRQNLRCEHPEEEG